MKAAIVGSGFVDNYIGFADELRKCDIIICADGGIKHLMNVDIPPHIIVGDFDSCDFDSVLKTGILKDSEVIRHNPVKNDTDMQLCIDLAIEKGCRELVLFAALGGRVDHELSNIFHLKYMLDNGIKGCIYSHHNRVYITNSAISIRREEGFKLSIIPLTPSAKGVTLKGLLYPLENADLSQGTSLGISNEFRDEIAEIYVEDGVLLVFVSKDN